MTDLQVRSFQPEYRSGYDDLLQDFYRPALSQSVQYWRAVGFFSSTAFEAIGRPIADFASSGGRMRLVTSVHLQEDDYQAIQQGLDRRQAYEERLLQQIEDEFVGPFGKGSALLTKMLETGQLEMQIAAPKNGYGIYHEKVGIFFDTSDGFVAFSGSSNESRTALEVNYECIDVFTSWEEPTRALAKKRHFEQLWKGKAEGADTFAFPDAITRELIHRNTSHSHIVREQKPSLENKWRHQDKAIELFLQGERGILEMATGTGKTKTALRICQKLIERGLVETVIVATSGNDLLDQWYAQLLKMAVSINRQFSVSRDYNIHRDRDMFLLSPKNAILLTSRLNLPHALSRLSSPVAHKTILIHDEVHGLGSPENRNALAGKSETLRFRLGLSATPERDYDTIGNEFIESHVGPVLYKFELADAIERGILVSFDYFPLSYTPDQRDRDAIQQVHRWAAARRANGEVVTPEQIQIKIAHVYKTSHTKLPVFQDFIARHPDLLKRCIVFVETKEYGDKVLAIVHQHRHDFHTYYGEEDKDTLRRFARGDIECLITCHRLSEGIDIQSIQSVILFSSSRSRLETIQRIGRCLRTDPSQPEKIASVVDFIRTQVDPDDPTNADQQRRIWLEDLAKRRYTAEEAL